MTPRRLGLSNQSALFAASLHQQMPLPLLASCSYIHGLETYSRVFFFVISIYFKFCRKICEPTMCSLSFAISAHSFTACHGQPCRQPCLKSPKWMVRICQYRLLALLVLVYFHSLWILACRRIMQEARIYVVLRHHNNVPLLDNRFEFSMIYCLPLYQRQKPVLSSCSYDVITIDPVKSVN